MWLGALILLLYAMLVLLVSGIVAASFLAVGTALALLFGVSVWEATVVTLLVAAGLLWLLNAGGFGDAAEAPPGESLDDADEPGIYVTNLPARLRPNRKRRRR